VEGSIFEKVGLGIFITKLLQVREIRDMSSDNNAIKLGRNSGLENKGNKGPAQENVKGFLAQR
jgi:hypothetical protein